jgi:anti-sigma factor RsiW
MTHEVIKHLLDDYVTGDLTEDARAPVAEHIAACDLCRSEIESLQAVVASARELPRSIEPPAEAWTGIRSAIARDENAVRTPGSTARFGERRRLYLAAAAVVLAAVLSSAGTAWYLSARNPAGNLSAAMAANTSSETPATLAAFTMKEKN